MQILRELVSGHRDGIAQVANGVFGDGFVLGFAENNANSGAVIVFAQLLVYR